MRRPAHGPHDASPDVVAQLATLAPPIPPDPDGLVVARAAVERARQDGASEVTVPEPSRRRARPRRRVVLAGAVAGVLVVGGVVAAVELPQRGSPPATGSAASVTLFTSPQQIAAGSEYLVRGTVLDAPTFGQIGPDDPSHYAVVHVKVTSVLAARPDVPAPPTVGQTIVVGFNVFDPAPHATPGYGSGLDDVLPYVDEVPAAGANVVEFLTRTTLGSAGRGYEAVGGATVDASGRTATFAALFGPLDGTTVPLSALTGRALIQQFDAPSPWKETDGGS